MIISKENTIPLNINTVALKLIRYMANEWQISAEEPRKLFSFLEDEQFEAWMSGNLHSDQPDLLLLVSHLKAI